MLRKSKKRRATIQFEQLDSRNMLSADGILPITDDAELRESEIGTAQDVEFGIEIVSGLVCDVEANPQERQLTEERALQKEGGDTDADTDCDEDLCAPENREADTDADTDCEEDLCHTESSVSLDSSEGDTDADTDCDEDLRDVETQVRFEERGDTDADTDCEEDLCELNEYEEEGDTDGDTDCEEDLCDQTPLTCREAAVDRLFASYSELATD